MKILALTIAAFGMTLALGACDSTHTTKTIENVPQQKPTKVELYLNVPGHPTLARECIDHEAFVTSSSGTVIHVPSWDAWCP